MADISKITLPSGSVYNIKDEQARSDIAAIQSAISGGVTFMGETTTALADGATASSITINGSTITAVKGYLVVSSSKEFVYDGSKWIEMGDLSILGALAYQDTASADYTPAGTVSQPSFTGTSTTSTGTFTPSGSVSFTNSNQTATVSAADSGDATFTPAGSVSTPTISVATAGSTTTVNSITAVGTLPAFGATVSSENLTLSWDAGSLPTKGDNTTVKTGDAAYSASQPTFTGTAVRLVTGNISVPSSASFSGTEGNVSVTGTPSGTVSQPTFSGTQATITVS